MLDFKGHRFEKDLILLCIRWYVAYPLSYRHLEEMMAERGVAVDHTNIYRWVQKFTPLLEGCFRQGKKQPVGSSGNTVELSVCHSFGFIDLPFVNGLETRGCEGRGILGR